MLYCEVFLTSRIGTRRLQHAGRVQIVTLQRVIFKGPLKGSPFLKRKGIGFFNTPNSQGSQTLGEYYWVKLKAVKNTSLCCGWIPFPFQLLIFILFIFTHNCSKLPSYSVQVMLFAMHPLCLTAPLWTDSQKHASLDVCLQKTQISQHKTKEMQMGRFLCNRYYRHQHPRLKEDIGQKAQPSLKHAGKNLLCLVFEVNSKCSSKVNAREPCFASGFAEMMSEGLTRKHQVE